MNDVELALRKLLWIRHGCTIGLYGDDGELQCNECHIDFLRDSPVDIEWRFIQINQPKIYKALQEVIVNLPRN